MPHTIAEERKATMEPWQKENDALSLWLVWNPEAGFPTCRHYSKEAAVKEAERLAELNRGQQFFVMGALGVAKVHKPSIYRAFERDDQVPF
jgi:hypothetical protein